MIGMSFFSNLGDIKGLVQNHVQHSGMTARGEEQCHLFRFLRRDNLAVGLPVDEGSWNEVLAPGDVFLCVKPYMSSDEFSQVPMKVFPMVLLDRLPAGPQSTCNRSSMSERQIREFLKTARFCASKPWSLHSAEKYLLEVCLRNDEASGETFFSDAPEVTWVTDPDVRVGDSSCPGTGSSANIPMHEVGQRRAATVTVSAAKLTGFHFLLFLQLLCFPVFLMCF